MEENHFNCSAIVDWEGKSITISDSGRILDHIQHDLEDYHVPLHILHYLYLLATNSKKFNADKIPATVITMNSEILINSGNNRKQKIKIVYPEDIKNPEDVSIYSPLGAACLGAHEKSKICFFDGKNLKLARIEKVLFQPEKEKLFYL